MNRQNLPIKDFVWSEILYFVPYTVYIFASISLLMFKRKCFENASPMSGSSLTVFSIIAGHNPLVVIQDDLECKRAIKFPFRLLFVLLTELCAISLSFCNIFDPVGFWEELRSRLVQ